MDDLFANSGDPDQMPHSAASDLNLLCLPFTLLGVSRLQWVKVLSKIVTDDIIIVFVFSEKMGCGISYEFSVKQTIHMKCCLNFSEKIQKKKKNQNLVCCSCN